MKLTIPKNQLAYSIKMVAKAMSSQSTIPVLSGIHIYTNEVDELIFETTDLDVSIKHKEDALVEEGGSTVVPGKIFGDIINSFPDEAVSLETRGEKLTISCGGTVFTIATLNPLDFPQFPQITPTRSIEVGAPQLAKMVRRVSKATSKDVSRAVLTGIYLEVKKGVLRLAATDSYRLAITKEVVKRGEGQPQSEDIQTIIPGSILDEIGKLTAGSKEIRIGESDNQIIFSFGSTTFISRKIEGNYPNFEQIIPTQKNVSVVVETDLLLSAVKRVSIVAKNTSPIRIALHADTQQIEISAQTPDIGNANESIPAQIDGEEISIGFNHQYILDGLNAAGTEELVFEAQTSVKPGIFRSIGSEEYFYLTMPVRLDR